jgi:hypothetical protein
MNTKITTAVFVVLGAVIVVALTLWVASFTLFAGAAGAGQATTSLTLLGAKPQIIQVDFPTDARVKLEHMSADLTTESGENAGVLSVSLLIVHVNEGARADYEARDRTLTFDTPDGEIQAAGLAYYPQDELELAVGKAVVIAVVGGTGKYLGVTGEVKTTHLADGTYEHLFTFVTR